MLLDLVDLQKSRRRLGIEKWLLLKEIAQYLNYPFIEANLLKWAMERKDWTEEDYLNYT